MSKDVDFESNLGAVVDATEDAIKRALEIIGGKAETKAAYLTKVDTGLLRNSITHALGGAKAATSSYTDKDGKQKGKYSGKAPKDGGKTFSVYVGSNVEYAPFVELGTSKMDPRPYLRPAIEDNIEEYKQVLEAECGKIK